MIVSPGSYELVDNDDNAQKNRFRELLAAALADKARGENAPSAERLLYVLELLASSEHTTPEVQLTVWLRRAL